MSRYTSFALAGPGGLGSFIAQHLAAASNTSLRVLTRNTKAELPPNAELKLVNYESEDSLVAALQGVEVVVSALNGPGFGAQPALARAAKKAGVKLFVPSEFGNPTAHLTSGPLHGKTQLQGLLRELGLDYLLLHNGPFTDTTFSPYLGFDFDNGKVNIIGEGNNPVPLTTRNDVGRFLAHVLTTLPPAELANKTFSIQGDIISFNRAVELYKESHPDKKVQVTYTPRSEAESYIEVNPGFASVLEYLRLSWDVNVAPREEETAHSLYPDWHPTLAKEVIEKL